ncbi:iron ABC transporter permease [Luteolibacter pohnpeiensis]|uniref:Iron ABC transporter permease n=1 Tax=Luteolibacter pohnpeiensis TaxID=454153 RepID=A0A934VXA3_9BACT|nr:iron ABC transporter permease [Luteolibacter pohnpeiensis]MBK1884150.1 iron ABC transporter permease [Luteolibacter pohnpeiensis]
MKRAPAILITLAITILFAVFFVYPAGMVVKQAFEGTRADGSKFFTLEFLTTVFKDPIYREGLWNAFALGITSTLATLAIAFPLALIGHRYDFPWKKALGVLVLAPLILPPFVGAVGVKQMLGVNGAFNAFFIKLGLMQAAHPFDWLANGRFAGIVIMNALHLYPILYMNIAAALANLDPAMEQAAENLGCPPWKRFLRITFPLSMPGVFAGSSIVFIWAFTELGVPLVFDYARVAPVQIFDGLKGLDNNPIPYALTAILLIVAAIVFTLSKLVLGKSPLGTAPRPKGRANSYRLSGGKAIACTALYLTVFLLASIPHIGVFLLSTAGRWYGTIIPDEFTIHHYTEALGNELVVPSIQNSLLYAGTATLIALVIGLGVAWVVVRSKLKSRGLLDAMVMMPLAVPGLVMAFGYLALSQEGKPFHFLVGATGSPFFLLVIAYAIRRLPYIVRSAVAGLQQSNPALEEAARSLGASPARMLRRVAIPLIGANLAAGSILAFAFAMLEVSDSLILAQQTQHYPITKAIYTLLSTLGNGTELAAALGVWSMVFLSVAIMGAAILGGKRGGLFRV